MAGGMMTRAIGELRRATLLRQGEGASDADLLDAFLLRRDEAAFEALIRRHGPLVLGVCRRVLGDLHDAEDAFQAVFLVLFHQARSLRSRAALGAWLYAVAYRTSLKARARRQRLQGREASVAEVPERGVEMEVPADDLLALLDEELNGLPERYRVAVVLCELQGRTRRETSQALNIPEGTLSSRLAAARTMLRARLAGRGVVLSAGALAAALSPGAASAGVPTPLVLSTLQAVRALAAGRAAAGAVSAAALSLKEGVVKAMFFRKLKRVVPLVLALAAAVALGGFVTSQSPDGRKQAGEVQVSPKKGLPGAKPQARGEDAARILGTWALTSLDFDDKKVPGEQVKGRLFVFAGGKYFERSGETAHSVCTYKLDPSKNPKEIDLTPVDENNPDQLKRVLGIYTFEGEDLVLSTFLKDGDKKRPTAFAGKPGSGQFVWRFSRAQQGQPADKQKNGAGKPEDGIYVWVEDGPGPRVRRNDGAQVVLVQRLGGDFGKASLRSVANDNSQFQLDLKGVGPLAEGGGGASLAAVLGGVCLAAYGQSEARPDRTLDMTCYVHGEKVAEQIAARLKIEPALRKHPGHRILTRWIPEKETYHVGETVTLKMEIRNVGEAPLTFFVGGQQRGPRDNQYRFLARRGGGHGRAVHDVGDPTNFGGIGSFRTLKPGETFTTKVALDKWFSFVEPDVYRVTGLFQLQVYAAADRGGFGRPIWDDFAVGDCLVRVVPEQK
jgi:RNA polymerase sigma factor (sigma-70 family)